LYVGESNMKIVRLILHKESHVPRKHGKGGQSQRRFERDRLESLKHWFKKVAEITYETHNDKLI